MNAHTQITAAERDLNALSALAKAIEQLTIQVKQTGQSIDLESPAGIALLNATYDLTEVDGLYDLAQEYAPCPRCNGDGVVENINANGYYEQRCECVQ